MCQTEEESSMSMLSSVVNLCHMCGFSMVKEVFRGQAGTCGTEAVDF